MTTEDALRIRTRSGRLIRTVAYPSSLGGSMAGYPRSRRAARRIEEFCSGLAHGGGGDGVEGEDVTYLPRSTAVLGALGLGCALFGCAVLIELL